MANAEKIRASKDKYDAAHFKYQTVKMKISEHEQLRQAVALLGVPANTFMRDAIMQAVERALQDADEIPSADNCGGGE